MSLWPCRRVFPLLALCACQASSAGSGPSGSPQTSDAAVDHGAGGDVTTIGGPDGTADQMAPGNGAGGAGGATGTGGVAGDAPVAMDAGAGTGGATVGGPCQAMFCESFEDVADGAPPNPAIWTRTSNDILVDSTRAARGGTKALHIPPLVSGAKYIRENKTIAAMGTSFYGRMYLWIEQQPKEKPASLYHWTMLEADELQDYNAGKVIRIGGHIEGAGTNWVRFNFQTHNNPGETGLSDQQEILNPQRWYCVEFYYSLPDNEARVWLDGVEDPKLHWKGPMGGYTFPTAITWMTFGWAEYQAAKTPWEVWIDEIAIDTKKIGCQ